MDGTFAAQVWKQDFCSKAFTSSAKEIIYSAGCHYRLLNGIKYLLTLYKYGGSEIQEQRIIWTYWSSNASEPVAASDTDAQKPRMQSYAHAQTKTLHTSSLTFRVCQPGILKDFIYCSSNHKSIKCLQMWLISAVMGKRTLHLTLFGVYPVHLNAA